MTYIVNENCIKCKYMDCVEVCPVDCFYEGENMLVIHPDECIDCGVCEPECPFDAIKPDTEPDLEKWLELNREYAEKWPNIMAKKDAPPDADKYRGDATGTKAGRWGDDTLARISHISREEAGCIDFDAALETYLDCGDAEAAAGLGPGAGLRGAAGRGARRDHRRRDRLPLRACRLRRRRPSRAPLVRSHGRARREALGKALPQT